MLSHTFKAKPRVNILALGSSVKLCWKAGSYNEKTGKIFSL